MNRQFYRLQQMIYWIILILIPVLVALSAAPASGRDKTAGLLSEFRIRVFPIPEALAESPMRISFHGSPCVTPDHPDSGRAAAGPSSDPQETPPANLPPNGVSLEIGADVDEKTGVVYVVLPF